VCPQLPQILEKLLPGLLPLANQEELRPQVLLIVCNLNRRIRTLRTQLPCATLLTKLVQPDLMPFACNITLTLLDIALLHEDDSRRAECAQAVLNSTAAFYPPDQEVDKDRDKDKDSHGHSHSHSHSPRKVFSMQLDALLNYSLDLLPFMPAAIASSALSSATLLQPLIMPNSINSRLSVALPSHPLALFWDFLLDLSLAQAPLVPNTLGSVQPGLSQQRVQRLCRRVRERGPDVEPSTGWFLPQLKQVSKLTVHTF
jgi:hypothetical protein